MKHLLSNTFDSKMVTSFQKIPQSTIDQLNQTRDRIRNFVTDTLKDRKSEHVQEFCLYSEGLFSQIVDTLEGEEDYPYDVDEKTLLKYIEEYLPLTQISKLESVGEDENTTEITEMVWEGSPIRISLCKRIEKLFREMLDRSRVESGKKPYDPKLLEDVIRGFEILICMVADDLIEDEVEPLKSTDDAIKDSIESFFSCHTLSTLVC